MGEGVGSREAPGVGFVEGRQLEFGFEAPAIALPHGHAPAAPKHFPVERIYLAKGSLATPERERFADAIRGVYPRAEVIRRLETAHPRIDLETADPLERHRRGKRSLVLGEHRSAVRFSSETGNTCPMSPGT